MQDQLPLKIFIVYAREDLEALKELRVQFIPVTRSEQLEVWYDGEILPGQHWDTVIKTQLRSADIILLFISKYFFASEYIQSTELEAALDRHKDGKSVIIPIIVRPCVWQGAFSISKFQALPENAYPIFSSYWRDHDEAMVNVVEGIKKVASNLRVERLKLESLQLIEKERVEAIKKEREQQALLKKQSEEEMERINRGAILKEKQLIQFQKKEPLKRKRIEKEQHEVKDEPESSDEIEAIYSGVESLLTTVNEFPQNYIDNTNSLEANPLAQVLQKKKKVTFLVFGSPYVLFSTVGIIGVATILNLNYFDNSFPLFFGVIASIGIVCGWVYKLLGMKNFGLIGNIIICNFGCFITQWIGYSNFGDAWGHFSIGLQIPLSSLGAFLILFSLNLINKKNL